jgi:hypothetical protein
MSELPERPHLDQLRRQARELLRAAEAGEPHARGRLLDVSDRVTLSAAQVVIAREYGFPSWPALHAEVTRRRRFAPVGAGDAAGHAAADHFALAAIRRSLGGATTTITAAAGTLSVSVLIVGPDHAFVDAALMPSVQTEQQLAGPPRERIPVVRFITGMLGRNGSLGRGPAFDDVVVRDDRDAAYVLRVEQMVVPQARPGQVRGPIWMRLMLDPAPPADCTWIDMRGPAGPRARLLPAEHPEVRVTERGPAAGNEAEVLAGQQVADDGPVNDATAGPSRHLDLGAYVPAPDGLEIQLDTLVSDSARWQVYLRAFPGWWLISPDNRERRDRLSVTARDNLGGVYASTFAGGADRADHCELALRFRPPLDPRARSVALIFTGQNEQATARIALGPARRPRGKRA